MLSYETNKIPTPVTNPDNYMYAQLVEMRLIRNALQDVAIALNEIIQRLDATKPAPTVAQPQKPSVTVKK